MTLPLQAVSDPATDQNHRQIAQQFPIQSANIAAKAVTAAKIAIATITDNLLAKPVIAGLVEGTGTKASGSGFSSEKTGTGVYKVTLETELATLGSFVAMPIAHALIVEGGAASKKAFTVAFYERATGALLDTAFSFHVKAT